MPDKFSADVRSNIMRKIKSKNTVPEMILRKKLWHLGYRYRLHFNLPGKPDIVFPKQRIVIFMDGCFWHKCPDCFKMPKSNVDYWESKLNKNVERDIKNDLNLIELGWKVHRFWEHEIKNDIDKVVADIVMMIELKE